MQNLKEQQNWVTYIQKSNFFTNENHCMSSKSYNMARNFFSQGPLWNICVCVAYKSALKMKTEKKLVN